MRHNQIAIATVILFTTISSCATTKKSYNSEATSEVSARKDVMLYPSETKTEQSTKKNETLSSYDEYHNPNSSSTHVVAQGETLYAISKRYNTTVEEICRLNNIRINDPISIGQRLAIKEGGQSSISTAQSAATQVSDAVSNSGISTPVYHLVRVGETLYSISKRYDTTVEALCALNGMLSTTPLSIDQKLRVK